MSYKLKLLPSARKQWNKLDHSIKEPLRKKLRAVLDNPQVPKNKLHGYEKLYKIKHRASRYRLVYEVENSVLTVTVVMIGKREKGEVYKKLFHLKQPNSRRKPSSPTYCRS